MGSEAAQDLEAHPGRALGRNNEEQPEGLSDRVAGSVVVPLGSDDEVNASPQGGIRVLFNKFIWHGGSVYDAWLNASSAQVGQVILTMPTSYAQMGFTYGVIFQTVYTILGAWTCYLLARLYVEYRHRKEKEGHDFKKHVIQYHEVIANLVAPWARYIVLFFNIMTVGSVATVQIIACASNAYYLSDHLNKQQWALIFGAISMFMVLVPTLHNFRVFSLVGILTTTYTAWYMFIASLKHGQVGVVKHSAPNNIQQFFTGTTNILFSTGGHAVTIEIMHAMWSPRKYKYVYIFTCLYVLTITMPHCVATYWAFGDVLLTHANAFSVFPPSTARTVGLVFMITHQAVAFGLYVMPLFFMWEKLWGIHTAWFPLRVVMRLPVAALLWFLALAFPFFGPFNSIVGAIFISFSTFMIPCIAFIYVFWTPQARQTAAEKTSKFLPRGKAMLLTNVAVVVIIATLGTGLGGYASIYNIVKQINTFGLFEKCYQCTAAAPKKKLF
ncbi:unnamed protein product [Calypogeia fissa]